MEPTFICYNNLTFDDEKKFLIDFSDEDLLEGVVFKKKKGYYITSMTCYVDLTVDITKLPNYAKIKQTSGLGTAILRGSVDFGYGKKELMLGKTSGPNLILRSDKSRRDKYLEDVEFFDIENKKRKKVHIYSAYKKIKDRGLKFLTTDQNNSVKNYTVKSSSDLKFLTRFLNGMNESFIEQYTKKSDNKNVIFIRDVSCKSGYIPFKLDLTKEYIKQLLLINKFFNS